MSRRCHFRLRAFLGVMLAVPCILAGMAVKRCKGDDTTTWPSQLDETALRELPRVHSVTTYPVREPKRRIIHVVNQHYVERLQFHNLVQKLASNKLSEAEIDDEYDRQMKDFEEIQADQLIFLRALIKRHRVPLIYLEGLPSHGGLTTQLGAFRGLERERRTRLTLAPSETVVRLHQRRARQGKFAGVRDRELERRTRLTTVPDGSVVWLRQPHVISDLPEPQTIADLCSLFLGAGGRLFLSGELAEVRGIEPPFSFESALSQPGDDDWPAFLDKRETEIVRTLLSGDPVAIVILGASHDLNEKIRRGSGESCEYIRVETMVFWEKTAASIECLPHRPTDQKGLLR